MKNVPEYRVLAPLAFSSFLLIVAGFLAAALVGMVFLETSSWWEGTGRILWGALGASLGYFIPLAIAARKTEGRLQAFGSSGERDQSTLKDLQALPYFTSRLMFLFWCVWAALFSLVGWFSGEQDPLTIVMVGAGSMVLAVAESLLITAWHKRILGAVLLYFQQGRVDLMAASASRRHSIRFQVARALVGLIFFACGISLLVTLSQQQRLVLRVVSDHMHIELDRLYGETGVSSVESCEASGTMPEDYYLVVVRGDRLICTNAGASVEQLAGERWEDLGEGPVSLGSADLVGWAGPLTSGKGWVMMVTPKPSELRNSVRLLLVFFTILFVFSVGLVSVVSQDLTTPVLDLTRRVREFSADESAQIPAQIPVRADEIGELTLAFERMRESLAERIRLIEEMNRSLESTVEERTQELKKSQQELLRSEKMASLGRLVAGVAHEINNPLNSVLNNITPLQERLQKMAVAFEGGSDTRDLDDMSAMLALVEEGAARTARIVEALRVFSHPGSFEVVPVAVHARFDVALDLLRHRFPQQLRIERQPESGEKALCDVSALDQILLNLLTNALDAVAGESEPRIRLGEHHGDDGMEITVEDNGTGIPEADIARIFDPFFTTKEVGEGTGLGLSIVHALVDRHGGCLRVEPSDEKGTIFTVVLPANREDLSEGRD